MTTFELLTPEEVAEYEATPHWYVPPKPAPKGLTRCHCGLFVGKTKRCAREKMTYRGGSPYGWEHQ